MKKRKTKKDAGIKLTAVTNATARREIAAIRDPSDRTKAIRQEVDRQKANRAARDNAKTSAQVKAYDAAGDNVASSIAGSGGAGLLDQVGGALSSFLGSSAGGGGSGYFTGGGGSGGGSLAVGGVEPAPHVLPGGPVVWAVGGLALVAGLYYLSR